MTHSKALALALSLGVFAYGCEDPKPTAPAAPAPTPTAKADDHGHDHADGDHDHEHADGDAGHHKGERHDLGKADVGGASVQVTQIGDVKAGAETPFEIVVAGKPAAVRAWLGNEAGDGSVKVKAAERSAFYDADIESPEKLPEGSKLWVEVESADGKKAAGAFATKP